MSATLRVPKAALVAEGATQAFHLGVPHKDPQAFVVRWQGELHVWVNRCAHIPVPLDYDDGEFLHPNLKMIACKVHGALYDPASGQCVSGPCRGDSLDGLDFEVDGDDLLVQWPN